MFTVDNTSFITPRAEVRKRQHTMNKKRDALFVGLIIIFFATVASANIVEDLEVTCLAGSDCALLADSASGGCRTITFSTSAGEIVSKACEKDAHLEVYRQAYPQNLQFEVCFANACIDETTGFSRISLDQLTTDPDVGQTQTEPPSESSTIPATPSSDDYPLSPTESAPNGISYSQILEDWNDATWTDTVDESIDPSGKIAAVRWYKTEGQCTGEKCEQQLHNGNGACTDLDVSDSKFCGVTDEFSNVLLNHAMGSDRARYDKLHRFSEKLRHPEINNLQCWRYYVTGDKSYNGYSDLCASKDSASDASIRILGAYALACAKQRSGAWPVADIDYCADYVEQGNAIWGIGTSSHGEIKQLSNGNYFLCNGYNNQVNCPTASQSIRPDYYELQFLMDFADYVDSDELRNGVLDMLDSYIASLGDNKIHRGKTGKFNSDGLTGYQCTDLCGPEYMDNIDSWRAVPALTGLLTVHDEKLTQSQQALFDYWWNNYLKTSSPTSSKPFEIFSQSSVGRIKSSENSYKTLSMWIPLAVSEDPVYAETALNHLINQYDPNQKQFTGAAYYGGYFSQFAQRAIGSATGMLDPSVWDSSQSSTNVTEPPVIPPIIENVTTNSTSNGTQIYELPETRMISSLSDFIIDCDVPPTMVCDLVSDSISGACRTVKFSSQNADMQAKLCDKGNGVYELYKQTFPQSTPAQVCFENQCVSQNVGFRRFTLSDVIPITVNTPGEQDGDAGQPEPPQPSQTQWSDLPSSCQAQGSPCTLKSDNLAGTCRDVVYSTNSGDVVLKACKKSDTLVEVYRNKAPQGLDFEACLGGACVDEVKGFATLNI